MPPVAPFLHAHCGRAAPADAQVVVARRARRAARALAARRAARSRRPLLSSHRPLLESALSDPCRAGLLVPLSVCVIDQ
jgi:hypothetical protein